MKKILIGVLLISLLFAALGCSPRKSDDIAEPQSSKDENDPFSGMSHFPEFKVKDIHDNEVNNGIFEDYKITLINLWATTCGPCIAELPDLEELHQEMKDSGVNIVGIIADGMVNEDSAKNILDKKSVTYTNIVPDEQLMEDFVSHTMWVPVSVMVDSKGAIVGKTISGARNKQEYRAIIQDTLNTLE
jgi:thiol-disulfide isomerase/thioredoxin